MGRVWAARDGNGQIAAVVGGLAIGPGVALDHFGYSDATALPEVLHAATEDIRDLPVAEAALFVPAGMHATSPQVEPWTISLVNAGWELLVERRHYEFRPKGDLEAKVGTSLRPEPLTGPDDPRLVDLHREVMRGTLDAHDQALVHRVGLAKAARDSLNDLLDADPWECIRLAFADDREPIGYAAAAAGVGSRPMCRGSRCVTCGPTRW